MNASDEQRLRNEVSCIHPLSPQGPPPTTDNNNNNPPPSSPSRKRQLQPDPQPEPDSGKEWPVNLTPQLKTQSWFDPQPDSGKEWPVDPTQSLKTSSWPDPLAKPNPPPETKPLSAEEQAKVAAFMLQQNAIMQCIEFFDAADSEGSENEDEDEDDVMSEDENGDDDDGEIVGYEQCDEYKFLLKLFVEDDELRRFYESDYGSGEFCCLVCEGVGEKVGKKFKGCQGLAHHAISVAKTKRMRAHRAFGHVICKVLGWDVNRFPAVVLQGEPLSRTLRNSVQNQDKNTGNADGKGNSLVNDNNSDTVIANGGQTTVKDRTSVGSEECVFQESTVPPVCNTPWPSGWPSPKRQKTSVTSPFSPESKPLSAEELAKIAGLKLQQAAVKRCFEFFCDADSEGSEKDDISEDENEEIMVGNTKDGFNYEQSKEYKFFLDLFVEDNELRGFYDSNNETGEFCCLVCGSIGEKVRKKFKGCKGLAQHAITVVKSKRTRAHRAFCHVICKVLGWDVNRFPMVVLKGESLSQTLANSVQTQAEHTETADGKKSDSLVNDHSSGTVGDNCGQTTAKASESGISEAFGCSSSNSGKTSVTSPFSPDKQLKIDAIQLQQKVLAACQEFFANATGSDHDEDNDHIENEDSFEACKQFKFFMTVFMENNELINYYEKNYKDGEFYCLVCGGIKKKVWNRCSALLQHSTTIVKTKKRSHRVFGAVVCKVFGWDIKKLPNIVSNGQSLLTGMREPQTKPERNDNQDNDFSGIDGGSTERVANSVTEPGTAALSC